MTSLSSTTSMWSVPASSRGRPWSRIAVLLIVLGVHVALVYVLNADRSRLPESSRDQKFLTLVPVEPSVDPMRPPPGPIDLDLPAPSISLPTPPVAPESAAGDQRGQVPPSPGIDWQGEIERAAREAAAAVPKEQLRLPCRGPRKFGDPPQTDCRPPPKLTEWEPEPPLAGFAGGLPFVALGKRCVIGLGFFGCGLGEMPKPNGEIFNSMDDPDRPRSSVPDDPR